MKLIGMLDSPYVRRTAIAMRTMNIPFEHCALSVFGDFDEIARVNPVVKVPTLVLDDGTVLIDSTLILDYLSDVATSENRLIPGELADKARAYKMIGMALAGCDKAVQLFYERNLKPADKQHPPWLQRITRQMLNAFAVLEKEINANPLIPGTTLVSITVAVIWQFVRAMLSDVVKEGSHPNLDALSQASELLPVFKALPPVGPGVGSA